MTIKLVLALILTAAAGFVSSTPYPLAIFIEGDGVGARTTAMPSHFDTAAADCCTDPPPPDCPPACSK